jgi:hypothetical protein
MGSSATSYTTTIMLCLYIHKYFRLIKYCLFIYILQSTVRNNAVSLFVGMNVCLTWQINGWAFSIFS